jgi:hypothetical protein
MREANPRRAEDVWVGCWANLLGGVALKVLQFVFGVVAPYICSFEFFGIPRRHYYYGGIVSFVLCIAFLSPIINNWAFVSTAGYDHGAEDRHAARYWIGILIVFTALTIIGAMLSYYFETEVVFQ